MRVTWLLIALALIPTPAAEPKSAILAAAAEAEDGHGDTEMAPTAGREMVSAVAHWVGDEVRIVVIEEASDEEAGEAAYVRVRLGDVEQEQVLPGREGYERWATKVVPASADVVIASVWHASEDAGGLLTLERVERDKCLELAKAEGTPTWDRVALGPAGMGWVDGASISGNGVDFRCLRIEGTVDAHRLEIETAFDVPMLVADYCPGPREMRFVVAYGGRGWRVGPTWLVGEELSLIEAPEGDVPYRVVCVMDDVAVVRTIEQDLTLIGFGHAAAASVTVGACPTAAIVWAMSAVPGAAELVLVDGHAGHRMFLSEMDGEWRTKPGPAFQVPAGVECVDVVHGGNAEHAAILVRSVNGNHSILRL